MIHHAKCKFCGCSFQLDIADEFMLHTKKPIDWWISLAACERCGDYRERLREHVNAVVRLCEAWASLNPIERAKVASAVDHSLTVATKALSETLSRHWKAQNTWDHEFVEILMDKPASGATAVRLFIRNTEKAGELFDTKTA